LHKAFSHPLDPAERRTLQLAENQRAALHGARKKRGDCLIRAEIGAGDIASMVRIGVLQDDQRQDRAAIAEALMQLAITGYKVLKDGTPPSDPSGPQQGQGHAACG
jgi:hypothetical protein